MINLLISILLSNPAIGAEIDSQFWVETRHDVFKTNEITDKDMENYEHCYTNGHDNRYVICVVEIEREN